MKSGSTLADAKGVCERLREKGIDAKPFWKPIHLQKPYLECPKGDMSVTEGLWQRIVTLPCSTERGLAVSVGDLRRFVDSEDSEDSAAKVILDAVDRLAENYEKRCEMGIRMQKLVDGMGAERCVRGMEVF